MQGLPPKKFPSIPRSPDPEMERQIGEIEGQIEDLDISQQLSYPPSPDLPSYKEFLFLRLKVIVKL